MRFASDVQNCVRKDVTFDFRYNSLFGVVVDFQTQNDKVFIIQQCERAKAFDF